MAAGRRFYSSEEATALILQGLSDNEDYSSDPETSESEEDEMPDVPIQFIADKNVISTPQLGDSEQASDTPDNETSDRDSTTTKEEAKSGF